MIAMVLAAGLGTRLRPYTDHVPKALVEIGGLPLIDHILIRLASFGIQEAIVNVHHHAPMLIRHLERQQVADIHVRISDESPDLLDTGGALRQAAAMLKGHGDILVHNADVLSDLDLRALHQAHTNGGNAVTLAVRSRKSGRYLLVSRDGALQGWTNASTGEYLWANEPQDACQPLAFSGIHFLSERVLDLFPDEVRFPLLPHYLRLAHGLVIGTWRHDEGQWTDLGRPEDLQNMRDWLSSVQGQDWIKKYHRGWSPS